MNLPNTLTLLRILLVPAFLIAVLYDWRGWALALFAAAALTDLLDGFLARRLEQRTLLGVYLDPVADKLLIAVAYVILAAKTLLPAWLAVLVVFRDLIVTLGAAVLYLTGRGVAIVPSVWGKQCTFLQLVTAGLVLATAWAGAWSGILPYLFILTGLLTVLSGAHYLIAGAGNLPPEVGGKPG